MGAVEGVGEPLLVAVYHEIDIALPPARDRLGFVDAGLDEAERAKRRLEGCGSGFVQRELDEIDTAAMGARRQLRQAPRRRSAPPAQLVKHHQERTLTVDGNGTRRSSSEAVVEDFQ